MPLRDTAWTTMGLWGQIRGLAMMRTLVGYTFRLPASCEAQDQQSRHALVASYTASELLDCRTNRTPEQGVFQSEIYTRSVLQASVRTEDTTEAKRCSQATPCIGMQFWSILLLDS